MASYHFTIKLDKKPDGTQVAAADHIDYVNRDGKFKDIDQKRQLEKEQFKGNILCAPKENQTTNTNNQTQNILYQNQYGTIIENGNRIETSTNSTVETLHIALALAVKKYGTEIEVQGTNQYKTQVIVAAVEMELPICFYDNTMELKRKELQEVKENDRRGIFRRSDKSTHSGEELRQPNLKRIKQERPPQRRGHLYTMSELYVAQDFFGGEGVLQSDVRNDMATKKEERRSDIVRRDFSRGLRIAAEKIADNILTKKQIQQVSAADHADYINRDEKFVARGGCVHKDHHLPKWAKNSPKKFFKAGDKYEQTSVVYREIEFALPIELNLDQQLEVVNQFVANHLGTDFYWALAIHEKEAAMGNGERNPHVHIMFSERKLDDIEKQNERAPEVFFKKGNRHHREKGGPNKDSKWNGDERFKYLIEMRKDCAMIQNAVLEKYGFDVTVDHRTLVAQREAALERGDMLLAQLLDRDPEKNLGTKHVYNNGDEKVVSLKQYRQVKKEHQQLIITADVLQKSILKDETTESVDTTIAQANFALSEIQNHNLEAVNELETFSASIVKFSKEISVVRNLIVWDAEALAMARREYLTPEEKELEKQSKFIKEEIFTLKRLEKELKKPQSWDRDSFEKYTEEKKQITNRLITLIQESKDVAAKLQVVNSRFYTKDYKIKLAKKQKQILLENQPAKDMLADLQAKLDTTVTQTRDLINKHLDTKLQAIDIHINKLLAPCLAEKESLEKEFALFHEAKKEFDEKPEPAFYHVTRVAWLDKQKSLQQRKAELTTRETELNTQIEAIKKSIYEAPPAAKTESETITTKPNTEEILTQALAPYHARKAALEKQRLTLFEEKAAFEKQPAPKFYETDEIKTAWANKKASFAEREAVLVSLETKIRDEMKSVKKSVLETKPISKPLTDIEFIQLTAKNAQTILAEQIRSLKSDLTRTGNEIKNIEKDVYSEDRIREMAKSKFANGAFQTIRKERKEIEKEAYRISKAIEERDVALQKLSTMEKPKWYAEKSEYSTLETQIKDMDKAIAERQATLTLCTESNAKQLSDLETKCNTPAAKDYIDKIINGILSKHKPTTDKYNALTEKRDSLAKQLSDLSTKKSILDKQVKHEEILTKKSKGNDPTYKVGVSSSGGGGGAANSSSNSQKALLAAAQRLADGIANPKIAALIARIHDHEEYDFAAMTPDQIETVLAKLSQERAM